MKIGAHVSIAGGIENAPLNAQKIKCECFQIFSRSPHGGNYKKITKIQANKFIETCQENNFEVGKDYIVHTPYFINLASENSRIYYGSIKALRDELETASLIKAPFVVTHIGSAKKEENDKNQEIINQKVLKAIEKIHENYQGSTLLLLEIAAGSGNIIGDTLEEIGLFIKEANKKKIKIGLCFDTCHAFAAGYDLRTPKKVKKVFDEVEKEVKLKNLKVIHFNDSRTEFNSHKDRHEHIGKGAIGLKGLTEVVKQASKLNINLYLETKHDKINEDLKRTKKMIK